MLHNVILTVHDGLRGSILTLCDTVKMLHLSPVCSDAQNEIVDKSQHFRLSCIQCKYVRIICSICETFSRIPQCCPRMKIKLLVSSFSPKLSIVRSGFIYNFHEIFERPQHSALLMTLLFLSGALCQHYNLTFFLGFLDTWLLHLKFLTISKYMLNLR